MLNKLCFILVLNYGVGGIVAQQSLRLDQKGDSCQVINFNCGGQNQHASAGEDVPRYPGTPGKIGPVGPVGPKGSKGKTGSPGVKGESGEDADANQIKADVLGMLSVTSCLELESEYCVKKTGYYLMRENGKPVYNFCDFNIYEGISTCTELWTRGKHESGYYRFEVRGQSAPPFVYCIHYDTCEQLKKFNGTNEPGVYTMSPGNNPFKVHCKFSSGTAITEVWHSSMEEVKATPECEDIGCYSWTPQYDVPERDILRIIKNSQTCRQFIKARCKGMVLLYHGDPRGWWVSRQGEKMFYWGGASSRRDGYCACGETESCSVNSNKCNCDQNDGGVITADEGFITDKSKLPVREIRLGDMGDASEKGWHTLGKLECMG